MKDYKKEGNIKGELEIDGNLILTEDLIVEKWIEVKGNIDCAGYSIKAGDSIKAGYSIKAGDSYGIKAGLYITAKTTISCGLKIFAGICFWRKIEKEEKTITCSTLLKGKVEYGILNETRIEGVSLSGKSVEVKIDGVKYEAVIK